MNFDLPSLHFLANPIHPWAGWAYLLLALLVAVEGPVTTLAGAAASSAGYLNPVLVFMAASLGNLTADTVWYLLGYMGKIEWLMHYGRRLGITKEHVEKLEEDIHAHIHKVLFAAKLSLGFVIPTLVAAGLARVPWRKWFWVLFVAECIWTGGLVLIGYYFGAYIQQMARDLRLLSLGGGVLFVMLGILYLARRQLRQEDK